MLPRELTASHFHSYPDKARELAVSSLPVLNALPIVLAVLLLREVARYDWLFPADQKVLAAQLNLLASLNPEKRAAAVSGFSALSVPASLTDADWVNQPKRLLEALTAHLWATHQIDAFHAAANTYSGIVQVENASVPGPLARTSIAIIPQALDKPGYPLFQKLRPYGVFFEKVTVEQKDEVAEWLALRVAKDASPFAHFCVDATESPIIQSGVETVSWAGVAQLREGLLGRLRRMMATPGTGPEMARTRMAELSPADLGLNRSGNNAVMDHFVVSVLTEGSGTQIFSTTWVQWSARELLHRAQPSTLVLRFGARQQLQPMNDMLADVSPTATVDTAGSFVDADMAAYYTWINQQRLPGSEVAGFLAYSESRRQAVAIGPGLPKGTTMTKPLDLHKLLGLLA